MDSVLSTFQNPNSYPLREFIFSIRCYLTISTGIALERWISFAIDNHNVQRLSMELFVRLESPLISFPLASSCNRINNLTHLKLSQCKILPSFERFPHLRSISLERCSVPEAAIESINLNCTLLKRLILSRIIWELKTLRVSTSLSRLKHLSIDRCSTDLTVVIESPNLTFLYFCGDYFYPTLAHCLRAPRLKRITLNFGTLWVTSHFLALVRDSGAEKVDLCVDLWKREKLDHACHSALNNVTVLRMVKRCLPNLDPLLKACLSLKSLKLDLSGSSSTAKIDSFLTSLGSSSSDGNWKHQNLEKIQIRGFRCIPSHLQLFKHMAELAAGLKKMVIIPSKPLIRDKNEDDQSVGEYIKDVANMLLPQGAELVIKRARR